MQTYTVHLSDADVERLRAAAEARQQTPDETLQATVEEAIREGMLTKDVEPSQRLPSPPAPADFTDPWAGFRGAFFADTPDIFERHDDYVGRAVSHTPVDPMIAVMKARGHLATLPTYQPPSGVEIPPYGSPEFDQLLEQIGAEASDALDKLGLDVIDLVER